MNKVAKPFILFDLGDTLMIHKDPWTNVLVRASVKMQERAITIGILDEKTSLARTFLARLKEYYAHREKEHLEGSTFLLLKDVLITEMNLNLSDQILRELLGEFYKNTRSNWMADPDAVEVLTELFDRGYTIALLSNAADHEDVVRLVEEFGYTRFFKFILTSADIGYRKPHPAIFTAAIQKLGCSPIDVTMIGDRLDADISGALNFGMSAVWLRRDMSDQPHAEESNFHVVRTLKDLLGLFPALP